MATTRARKTAATKTAAAETAPEETADITSQEDTPAADDNPAADSTPKAPQAAPLEPPPVTEPPAAPAMPAYATPTEVIPDENNLSEVIIDDATKEPPADVDAVFVPRTEYGSTLICTVRLVERTFIGPHSNPVHRLLQPAGAVVSEQIAARIRERLVKQAERAAAADTQE
ncbi:hypothetical protein [Streptomyces longispororuber]|uniref:hypothetical protein n=1 Tax=Streptomyces longispororuber TaxID=68230 RepID=UPI0036F4FAB9